MRNILALILAISFFINSCNNGRPSGPPNIILIIGDDISWDDIGAYGNRHIRTPHIDRLAAEGLRFDNVFLTASSCSPSRISLLTGRYPHNTGAAELHTPAPSHLHYFPELLKAQGYFTALAGKWHEGEETARAYDTLLVDKVLNGAGGQKQWINLLHSRPKDKPFFFWLAPYDAHRAWSANEEFETPYRPEDVFVPATLVDTEETRRDLAFYYNEITRLDDYIGKLIRALEAEGIADNTLLIFMADNGRAFPNSKTRLQDRGIKTPFVMNWPKGIAKKGAQVKGLVSSIDIAPTLLQIAGVEIPETIQGISFTELLERPDADFRNYVFTEHNWHDYEAYERAVRTEDFLYIINHRPQFDNGGPIDANQSPSANSLRIGREADQLSPLQQDVFVVPRPTEELYDLNKDDLQANNVIADVSYQVQLDDLRSILGRWQRETGDSTPERLTADWYHRQTGEPLPENGLRGEMPGAANGADKINRKGPY